MAATKVSIYNYPNLTTEYTSATSLDTFFNLAIKNIVALKDETNAVTDLTLGASSNVLIESTQNLYVYTGASSNDVRFFTTTGSNQSRVDAEYLRMNQDSNIKRTYITSGTGSNALWIAGTDNFKTTVVGDLMFQSPQYGHLVLSTSRSNITVNNDSFFSSNVDVRGDTIMQNNAFIAGSLFAYGNLFGTNMNLIKDKDSNAQGLDQVGYGFRINSDDQLELIKYAKYVPTGAEMLPGDRISRRVAVFGNTTPARGTTSDSSSSYVVFDEWNGTYIAQQTQTQMGSMVRSRYMWRFNSNMDIFSSGNKIGVGVEFPTADLDVGGQIKSVSITASNITCSNITTGELKTTSDIRLKSILPELAITSAECLQKVSNLDLIRYRFNNSAPTSIPKTGFSAQQVKTVIEEAVDVAEMNGLEDCHVIEPLTIIAYLVGAVKELASRIT